MKAYFERFALYNRWANARLYEAAGNLSPEAFVAPRSGFFPSIMRTLNHILVADRIWLSRLTGEATDIKALDQVLFSEFVPLRSARMVEDQRLLDFVSGLRDEDFGRTLTYRLLSRDETARSELGPTLAHIFNHQTHHRGQAHAMLSSSEVDPPALDFMYFLRQSA